jgi:hypothetical protein
MVGAPGPLALALPLRGPAIDILQLSGSCSWISSNAPGGLYEQDIFQLKIFSGPCTTKGHGEITIKQKVQDNFVGC